MCVCVCKDSKSFLSTKTKIFGDDEKKSDNFGKGRKWYFVTKFVLTYNCEKKLLLIEIDVLMKYRFWVYKRFFKNFSQCKT